MCKLTEARFRPSWRRQTYKTMPRSLQIVNRAARIQIPAVVPRV
jgi:hypothetical protein